MKWALDPDATCKTMYSSHVTTLVLRPEDPQPTINTKSQAPSAWMSGSTERCEHIMLIHRALPCSAGI